MSKMKKFTLNLPEYLLIAAVIFYWFSAASVINPIAISLIVVLILQMIFKNRIIGVLIPVLLIMTSLYMLLALRSELNEFPTFDSEAKTLLFVGLAFFISTITVSVIMIYKYSTMDAQKAYVAVNSEDIKQF